MITRRTALALITTVAVACAVPLAPGTALASLGPTDFGTRPALTTSPAQGFNVPLHLALSDLPAGTVVYPGGGNATLDTLLSLAGVAVPVTSDSLIAAVGDVSATFALTGLASSGDAAEFPVDQGTCLAAGAGTSCTLSARFAPTTVGAHSVTYTPVLGSVTVTAANPTVQSLASMLTGYLVTDFANQLSVDLNGTATPALVSVPAIAFGAVRLGTSASTTVPMANVSDIDLPLTPLVFDLAGNVAPPEYTVGLGTCSDPIPAHSTCVVSLTFTPIPQTNANAVWDLLAGPADPWRVQIPLSGHEISPRATFDVSSLSFPATAVGEVSAPQLVTITNRVEATAPLDVAGVTLSPSADFTVVDQSDCTAPLQAGDSCTLVVAFSPVRLGARTSTLTLIDDEPTTFFPLIAVTLSGTGTPAADLSVHLGGTTTRGAGKLFAKVVYTVTVTNTGPNPAAGTRATLALPEFAEFASTTRSTCGVPPVGATGVVSCTLGTLASGQVITFKVTVNVPEATGTKVTAAAAVASPVFDPAVANNSVVRTLSIK